MRSVAFSYAIMFLIFIYPVVIFTRVMLLGSYILVVKSGEKLKRLGIVCSTGEFEGICAGW
jgi:hypothetical protein